MTTEDANKLLALAKANYSYAFKTMTNQEKIMLVQSWAFALQDIPTDIVMLAFMQLLSTSKWLPTVAEIREQAGNLHHEASSMLWEIRSAEEMDEFCARSDDPSLRRKPEEQARIDRHRATQRAVADNILAKTQNLARGERGNENGLTLAAIVDSAERRGALAGGDMIRGLMMPPEALQGAAYRLEEGEDE